MSRKRDLINKLHPDDTAWQLGLFMSNMPNALLADPFAQTLSALCNATLQYVDAQLTKVLEVQNILQNK